MKIKVLFVVLRVLDKCAPSLAAHTMYRFMSTPRIRKMKRFEKKALEKAHQSLVRYRTFTIQKYSWGHATGKIALLVHGWEGRAGNFGAIVDVLIEKGYHVLAFDGPAHGSSASGDTSMFDYADFISQILPEYKPAVIISHSFGTVATVFAVKNHPDVEIMQWFALTSPYDFKDRIKEIQDFIAASDKTVEKLIEKIEKSTSHRLDDLNMGCMGSDLKNVRETIIIHSRSDKVIPVEDARRTQKAIQNSTLIELDDVGHYGILWSEGLRKILADKLALSSINALMASDTK
jgi:pimeloyl-ACP methyl ester carboxylesterase